MIIWSSWYKMNDEHKEECLLAIRKNLSNILITQVILLCEIPFPEEHSKLKCIEITERPSYKTFTDYFMKPEYYEFHNILLNTDIYVDDLSLVKEYMPPNSLYALTKYDHYTKEYTKNKPFWTQDCWILYKPNPINYTFEPLMGIPGCENIFAYLCFSSSIHVSNPSLSIKTYHCHKTEQRYAEFNYHGKKYSGLFIIPTEFNKKSQMLKFNKQKIWYGITNNLGISCEQFFSL